MVSYNFLSSVSTGKLVYVLFMEETRTRDNISEDCDDPLDDLEQVPYIGHQVEVPPVQWEKPQMDLTLVGDPAVKVNLALNWNQQIQSTSGYRWSDSCRTQHYWLAYHSSGTCIGTSIYR